MQVFDKKILTEAYKDYLMECIVKSKYLRKSLSFEEQLEFYNWVKDSQNKVLEQKIEKDIKNIRQLQSTSTKALNYVLMPPLGSWILNFLYRQRKDPCFKKCRDDKECQRKCALEAATNVIAKLRVAKSQCIKTRNPGKCIVKLDKKINDWEQKKLAIERKR